MEESAILKKIDEKYGAYYKSNTVLFKEGEKADKFFILREGLVKIVKTSPEMQITINTIEAGEVFGEMGLITNKPRNASGITLTECFIISLNEQILDTLITTNKKFVFYLLKLFGSKIRYLSSMVKDLTTGNDFVIITTHLMNYIDTVTPHSKEIALNLSETLKYITVESKIPFDYVLKSIEKLQKDDLFVISNDTIFIKDKKSLSEAIPRYF